MTVTDTLTALAKWAYACLAESPLSTHAGRIAELVTFVVDHEKRVRELEEQVEVLESRLAYLTAKGGR